MLTKNLLICGDNLEAEAVLLINQVSKLWQN